jgi:hypothetical protein
MWMNIKGSIPIVSQNQYTSNPEQGSNSKHATFLLKSGYIDKLNTFWSKKH